MTVLQQFRSGATTNAFETEATARQSMDLATRHFISELSRISRELESDGSTRCQSSIRRAPSQVFSSNSFDAVRTLTRPGRDSSA